MKPEVVLVTGCSTGIGRAIAQMLATEGYEVVATARKPEDLEGIGAAMSLRLDVTDEASIEAAVRTVLERHGQIDVLVNNAGYALRGAVEEVEVAAVQAMFDVNDGIIRLVRAVAPVMREQGSSRIINIGSIGGKLAAPANGTYSATKHAVEGLSDALRLELGAFGIDVVVLKPGNIASGFQETAMRGSGSLLAREGSPYRVLYTRFVAATQRPRAGEPGPEVVAGVVLAALRTRRPRARYKAAVPLATRIVASLPDRFRDLSLRRMYGLESPPPVRPNRP
jgi:NAD(P)-dependent dehydrogenase (short-subunit alcohol dehydrogenase family)